MSKKSSTFAFDFEMTYSLKYKKEKCKTFSDKQSLFFLWRY